MKSFYKRSGYSLLFHDHVNVHERSAEVKQLRYLDVLPAFISPGLFPPTEHDTSFCLAVVHQHHASGTVGQQIQAQGAV